MHALALLLHIAGGTVALGAGAATLFLGKGGRGHARAGKIFFVSMMVLFVSGAGMAIALSLWNVALGAGFGIYLIATSLATAQRRDGRTGRFELFALLSVAGCAIVDLIMGLAAATSATGRLFGYSPTPFFIFAGMAALAAGLDLNFILRRGVSQAQRIARHLWRMCAALMFVAFSFFVGQQKVMPASWHGSPWLFVPPLAVLAAMIFWLLRVRFSAAFGHRPSGHNADDGLATAPA